MKNFNPEEISLHFKNVKRVEDNNKFVVFRVFNIHGSDTGMISYLGSHEWRVYVDNFPGEKKYFQWNLPIKTLDDFIRDVGRTGLELISI